MTVATTSAPGEMKEDAIKLLKDTVWSQNFTDDLIDALASKMMLVKAEGGHVRSLLI